MSSTLHIVRYTDASAVLWSETWSAWGKELSDKGGKCTNLKNGRMGWIFYLKADKKAEMEAYCAKTSKLSLEVYSDKSFVVYHKDMADFAKMVGESLMPNAGLSVGGKVIFGWVLKLSLAQAVATKLGIPFDGSGAPTRVAKSGSPGNVPVRPSAVDVVSLYPKTVEQQLQAVLTRLEQIQLELPELMNQARTLLALKTTAASAHDQEDQEPLERNIRARAKRSAK
jgi:hypothetical protein